MAGLRSTCSVLVGMVCSGGAEGEILARLTSCPLALPFE